MLLLDWRIRSSRKSDYTADSNANDSAFLAVTVCSAVNGTLGRAVE